MGPPLIGGAAAPAVRARIAQCWLEAPTLPGPEGRSLPPGRQMGSITLHPHQSDAVDQVRAIMREFGGAILADAVGLGKTYVALALARTARDPLVITPAALRTMWQDAAQRAGTPIALVTTESLSRGGRRIHGASRDLVIVDEAHDFRNSQTKRYRALARLVTGTPVMLLTATPIHNRLGDLLALVSLFLGTHAWTLSEADRSRVVVRRTSPQIHSVDKGGPLPPRIDGPRVLRVDDAPETLEEVLALPPPVPPRDGGAAQALLAIGLVRQWASSMGALRGALRRRLQRAASLESAAAAGMYPSYRELRAWCTGDGAVQLAFPEIVIGTIGDSATETDRAALDRLLVAVRAHADAVRRLLKRLEDVADSDAQRATHLRAIMERHRGSPIVAFASYEDTVRALYRHLRSDGRVAMLTATGGVIASGTIPRAEVVAQFQPGSRRAPAARRIDLLLTTDIISQGVNLQAASAVLHLDLPWTPARLEQRVGRVARLGSPHDQITVYAMAPPATSESLLAVERVLRAKLATAGRAVGIAGSIVPSLIGTTDHPLAPGAPELLTEIRSAVMEWRGTRDRASPDDAREPIAAAVRSECRGFLAAGCIAGRGVLLASLGGGVSENPATIADAVRLAKGEPTGLAPGALDLVLEELGRWVDERQAVGDADLLTVASNPVRRRVLARIAAIARRAPPHDRPGLLALAARARWAAVARCGAGAEWVLGELAASALPDEAWLRAIGAWASAHSALARRESHAMHEFELQAILVLQPE